MRLGRCLDLCLEINLPEPPITSKEKTINQSASCEYYPRRAAKKPFYKGGTFVPRNARVGSAPNCWHRSINDRFYNYERIQLIAGQTPFKIRCLSSYRQEPFLSFYLGSPSNNVFPERRVFCLIHPGKQNQAAINQCPNSFSTEYCPWKGLNEYHACQVQV